MRKVLNKVDVDIDLMNVMPAGCCLAPSTKAPQTCSLASIVCIPFVLTRGNVHLHVA